MQHLVSFSAVAIAALFVSPPAHAASSSSDSIRVCSGSGSCTTVTAPCPSRAGGRNTKNVPKPYSDQAEYYLLASRLLCPAKLFTGSDGTGNGISIGGGTTSLWGTHQWHDAYSLATYG